MSSNSTDDRTLAQRAAAGDQAALAVLYDRHANALFAYIFHRLHGNRQDAEDVWHDSWLVAVRALASFRGDSSLLTWLCGIAGHKITDLHRRRGAMAVPFSDVAPEALERMLAGAGADDVAARSETLATVVGAVAALTAEYRTAILLRYAQGMPVEHVARQLGKSYKATESILSRARAALRAQLLAAGENDGY